nr:PREDICTED: cyclic nucleotide-gated channel cone photoreceptor subunit alpha-like [Anolis carolinensis]|eukprot:XP_016847442.1 PREDICTED: cyclic nucleotide-gated channel cone photoreceptor subunit alpha-like [Anolis carolinensis]
MGLPQLPVSTGGLLGLTDLTCQHRAHGASFGCRTHSLCEEDTSSELEKVISMETGGLPESRRNSFTGSGAMARLSWLVLSLRSWARRNLHHEDQRPDSFLERIRGPELKDFSSRDSISQLNYEDADGLKK